jgi:hypothetical protein
MQDRSENSDCSEQTGGSDDSVMSEGPSVSFAGIRCESKREQMLVHDNTVCTVRVSPDAAERNESETTDPLVLTCEERGVKGNPPAVKFCKISIPRNYREARASDQWVYWEQAMVEEKNSLDSHETMEYAPRPRGDKVIPVHWIYSVKSDEFGNVT